MADPIKVVVVPGFGGTSLAFRGGRAGKTTLWYNPLAMTAFTPLSMALDADGVTPLAPFGRTLFPDGPVQLGVYEPLLTKLSNAGLTPSFWGYDWRLSAVATAAKFAAYLRTANLANPFYVVAHSMGGLIAQLAYPSWRASNAGQTWGETVYLATPQGGSYWACATLAGYYDSGSIAYLLGNVYNVITAGGGVAALLSTLAFRQLGTAVGSWPGLYCLLPNSLDPWLALDPLAGQAQLLANYPPTPGGVQQQWLNLANQVMSTLTANYAQPRPTETCLVGDGAMTLSKLNEPIALGLRSGYSGTLFGDGTVTAERSTLPVGHSLTFKRTSHNGIVNTLGPLDQVVASIQAPPDQDAVRANDPVAPRLAIVSVVPTATFPPAVFLNRSGDP